MKKERRLLLMLRCAIYGSMFLVAACLYQAGLAVPAFAQFQGSGPPQATSGSGEPTQGIVQNHQKSNTTYYGIDVQEYIRQKYAVAGPYEVRAVSSVKLNLFTGQQRDLVFNLSGKKVKAMDTSGNQINLSSIQKGSRVLVMTKGSEVLIFLLPARKERKDG